MTPESDVTPADPELEPEAVVVTPFRYFMLLWATLYGFLFFAHIPRIETFIGAAIVSASGLYIFYRETKARGR